jgi:hypothetical protein
MDQKIVFLQPRPCRKILGLASLISSVLPLTASPAPTLNMESMAIQADYIRINSDFAQHDLKDVMAFFAPNFTAVTQNGQILTRKQTQDQYKSQLSQMKTMHSRYTVVSCSQRPNGVLMEIRVHTDGTGEKHVLFMKINGSFSNEMCVRDLWVKSPLGWQLAHRTILQDDTHIDPG